jgi:diacylglycerol kinase family enzyme
MVAAQRYVLFWNPHSRVSADAVVESIKARCASACEVVLYSLAERNDDRQLIEEAASADATAIVAIGGDGTVSSVAAAMIGSPIPLGIVPGGTTNMVAKVNGVPGRPQDAVDLIVGEHAVERIDVGRCGNRVLLHMGGVGLDARLFSMSSSDLKRRLRWLAYAPPLARAAAYPSSRVSIDVDGTVVELDSRLVLIANAASLIHPRLQLMQNVSRFDGRFDVLVFTASSWSAMIQTGLQAALMWLDRGNQVVRLAGETIRIDATPVMPFELDGEVEGETPLQIIVEPRALTVICGRAP